MFSFHARKKVEKILLVVTQVKGVTIVVEFRRWQEPHRESMGRLEQTC